MNKYILIIILTIKFEINSKKIIIKDIIIKIIIITLNLEIRFNKKDVIKYNNE